MTATQADTGNWSFPNRFTPVGSAAYYAIRFAPEATRKRNALLFAWHELIMQVCEKPRDPGAARLKLDWWRQEIARIQDGKASHPLAIGLQENDLGDDMPALMGAVVDVAEDEIRQSALLDDDTFVAACRNSLGSIFRLLDPNRGSANQDLGGYCAAVERIRHQGLFPQRVPAYLRHPESQTTRTRTECIDGLLERFVGTDPAATAAVPDFSRRMTALARAMQYKMRRQGYPASGPAVERAPIAHLWTAWRSRRVF
jgi:phytoene synthase